MSSVYDYGGLSLIPSACSYEVETLKEVLLRSGNTQYGQGKLVTIPVHPCALQIGLFFYTSMPASNNLSTERFLCSPAARLTK